MRPEVGVVGFGRCGQLAAEVLEGDFQVLATDARTADALTERLEQAMTAGSADLDRIDAGGLVPDVVDTNSWVQTVSEVDALERPEDAAG